MGLQIIQKDITTMKVDAIVNSTNHHMKGYSGVDKLIHELGGPELEAECAALEDVCMPGEAVHTNAYNLGCRYIIHTVSGGWHGGTGGEAAILRSCYRSSLELAEKLGCESVAFPLIAAGSLEYPLADALQNAVTAITEYLELYSDMDVYLVLFGDVVKRMADDMFGDLDAYIREHFRPEEGAGSGQAGNPAPQAPASLDSMVRNPGEDFVTMLLRLMDERGVKKASEIYKHAGMTKASYSKLKNRETRNPSKKTVVGLAMALKLSPEEADVFFAAAGLALNPSNTYDIIVRYFLETGNYSIGKLNEILYDYGYTDDLIGCVA